MKGDIMFSLLEDIIDVIAFRQFLTKGQKWFFVFFYAILGGILFVGNILLIGVRIFNWFLGLLVGGGKKK